MDLREQVSISICILRKCALTYQCSFPGKTSTIMACAKKMYGEHYSSMTLELNASDDRGIDVVRDQIKEFAGTKKLFRFYIHFVKLFISGILLIVFLQFRY